MGSIYNVFVLNFNTSYVLKFPLLTIQKEKDNRSLEEVHKTYYVAL